jgi:hypothetical protein
MDANRPGTWYIARREVMPMAQRSFDQETGSLYTTAVYID